MILSHPIGNPLTRMHVLQREMAPIAAAGAWNMGRWDEMSEYVYAIDSGAAPTSSANAFLRAVLDVHRTDYRRARGGRRPPMHMHCILF